jgi:hypothetical protein
MTSQNSKSTPANIAASALAAAADALHICASAINALDARMTFLEAALTAATVRPEVLAAAQPVLATMPDIDLETRSYVDTATAARWLNRRPQTLRKWACYEDGPLRPSRLQGRLKWAVADIRAALAAHRT